MAGSRWTRARDAARRLLRGARPPTPAVARDGSSTLLEPITARGGRGVYQKGGSVNATSGQGGTGDKAIDGWFRPGRYSREHLDVIYAESSAARRFVDIPVDDMFVRWRQFVGEDEAASDRFEDAANDLMLRERLRSAMRAARLYGTAILLIVEAGVPTEEPLDPERIAPGGVAAIHVFNRFQLSIMEWEREIESPMYGQPVSWRISPEFTPVPGLFTAHHSRCVRFDGALPPTQEGWSSPYDRDFGISELQRAVAEITQEAQIAAGVASLSQRASIPVIRAQGIREAMATGRPMLGDATADEIASEINRSLSNHRLLILDAQDDFANVSVTFAGLPDLMDRYAARLAAMAGIPETRFLGKPPVGFQATGESDLRNYAIHVRAMQESMLARPLRFLDRVVARHAGLAEPPPYEWLGLAEMSEADQAEVARARADALVLALNAGVLEENEVRERLSGDALFGELPAWSEGELEAMRELNAPEPPVVPPEGAGEAEEPEMPPAAAEAA